MKLTTHKQIKDYVIATLKTGNKKRIIKVMNRYIKWISKNHKPKEDIKEDIVTLAKKIFNG